MAAHQADADLEVLLLGFLVQREHPARTRTVDRDRLFHEDVDALVDRVLEMHPAEGRRRGENDDAAFAHRQSIAFL